MRQIFIAILSFRYRFVVLLSILIVFWSFLSPVLYSASYGPAITFTLNPNYHRAILLLAIFLLLPAVLHTREDILSFLHSTTILFIFIHLLLIVATVMFLISGNSLYDLHLMRILDTPPIYWESGLFLLCVGYSFVVRKMSTGFLIFFAVIGFSGLLLGNSRTRFLATFLCLLYFIYPYVSRRLIAWAITIVFLLAVIPLLMPHNVINYFTRLVNQRVEQSYGKTFAEMSSGRMIAYTFAYKRWKDSPFLGVGSCYVLPRQKTFINRSQKSMPRVHNYYLEVLAGQGTVGFIVLIAILGMTFLTIWRVGRIKSKHAPDARLIIAFFYFGIINWFFKESWGITYSTIVLIAAYSRIPKSATFNQEVF